jgi:hypothetical protein
VAKRDRQTTVTAIYSGFDTGIARSETYRRAASAEGNASNARSEGGADAPVQSASDYRAEEFPVFGRETHGPKGVSPTIKKYPGGQTGALWRTPTTGRHRWTAAPDYEGIAATDYLVRFKSIREHKQRARQFEY